MFQGSSHFSAFLHHFALSKLASSSLRVKVVSGAGSGGGQCLPEDKQRGGGGGGAGGSGEYPTLLTHPHSCQGFMSAGNVG